MRVVDLANFGVSTRSSFNGSRMNAAIRWAINRELMNPALGVTFLAEPGVYEIDEPIVFGSFDTVRGSWRQCLAPSIVGGTLAGKNPDAPACVQFRPLFDDEPAVVIQRARNVHLRGIAIDCSDAPEAIGLAIDPYGEEADWLNGAASRHPEWFVGKDGSSRIVCEGVSIINARVGVMIGAGVRANSDDITFRDSQILSQKTQRGEIGVCICHSQAGGIRWQQGGILRQDVAFCTDRYGLKSGSPCSIAGPLVSDCGVIVRGQTTVSPWILDNCRIENCGSIARLDDAVHPAQYGLLSRGCTIRLPQSNGEPDLVGSSQVLIEGGSIFTRDGVLRLRKLRSESTANAWVFRGVYFTNDRHGGTDWIVADSGGESIYYEHCRVSHRSGTPEMTRGVRLHGTHSEIMEDAE